MRSACKTDDNSGKMKQLLILILTLLTSCSTRQLSDHEKEFVGIWQVIPEMASGWADTYRFFDNGEFIFHYSQMKCDKRTLDYSGTWRIINRTLELTIDKINKLEGGELVPAMGACGSEFEIEGGQVKEIKTGDAEIQSIQLSQISTDPAHRDLQTATFDGKSFWKLQDDPNNY